MAAKAGIAFSFPDTPLTVRRARSATLKRRFLTYTRSGVGTKLAHFCHTYGTFSASSWQGGSVNVTHFRHALSDWAVRCCYFILDALVTPAGPDFPINSMHSVYRGMHTRDRSFHTYKIVDRMPAKSPRFASAPSYKARRAVRRDSAKKATMEQP